MKSRSIKYIGAALLVLAVAAIVIVQAFNAKKEDAATLKGFLGGEKIGIFEDEEIRKYVQKTYNLSLDYQKFGSFDMMRESHEGKNYLFPASQGAFEYYKKLHNKTPKNEIVYNTPIVIYSRPLVVDALVKAEVAFEQDEVMYIHMDKLVELMLEEKTWADLGLPQLNRSIAVDTTDPEKSNSGNMFAALLANTINGGRPVGRNEISKVLPDLQKIYDKFGHMETSSADMFSQFLIKGVGAYPLVASYENQLLEYAVTQPENWEKLKDEIVILYPIPTMWSSHVYVALDEIGIRGMEALMDPKVQELSWVKHGFRTGANSAQETDRFNVNGVAKEILSVTQSPDYEVIDTIVPQLR